PFVPTPPYQPDWPRVLTDHPYDPRELLRSLSEQPDWLNFGPGYTQSIAYTYATLGGYLQLRADRDFVMILIGDHQPPAMVSGESAPWDVPVHVVARRDDVLQRLRAKGFRDGLMPVRPSIARMHALLPVLYGAMSR